MGRIHNVIMVCVVTLSAIIKQPCLIIAKNGNDQREYITVKTISTNIFRHIINYIIEKHGSKEKSVIINGFQSIFKKQIEAYKIKIQ